MVTYHASKAFLSNISQGIERELKGTGVLYGIGNFQNGKDDLADYFNKWIESVRTIECGDYVTDAFDFLWNMDDNDIWYKIAEELANIVEYAVYKSKHKDEHEKELIEDYIDK